MNFLKDVLFILLIIIFVGGVALLLNQEDIDLYTVDYRVREGDTLYDIADKFCPEEMDKREYVYEVKQLNDTDGNLEIGEELKILVEGE